MATLHYVVLHWSFSDGFDKFANDLLNIGNTLQKNNSTFMKIDDYPIQEKSILIIREIFISVQINCMELVIFSTVLITRIRLVCSRLFNIAYRTRV